MQDLPRGVHEARTSKQRTRQDVCQYVSVCLSVIIYYNLQALAHDIIILSPSLQLEHELMYAPGFQSPPNLDYQGYCTYVEESLPPETPYLYGLHPNAEIGFLAQTSEHMFKTVLEMQPRDTSGGGGAGVTREEKVWL